MGKRRWPTGADLMVSAGVASLALAGLTLAPLDQPGFRDPDVLAVLLTFSQGMPLVARRQWPLAVLALVWLATVTFLMLRYPPVTTALAGVAVAVYGVAAYDSSPPESIRVALPGALAALLAGAAITSGYSPAEGAALLLVVVTAWVFGDRVRTRRHYVAALQERTELLERERESQAAAAAAAERTRIARELHDVVAHGVSVIVLHARGAREVLERDPAASLRSLDLIERTGRQALDELRAVVGALRAGESTGTLEPQPGLARLDELLRGTREAGLEVDLTIEGPAQALPTAVDLAAYRIVQEALANTLKHSTAGRARVVVRYGEDRLVVQVHDAGPGRAVLGRGRPEPGASGGHGLVGMRERVAMLGGSLEAGPREDAGYEVLAVLPFRRTAS